MQRVFISLADAESRVQNADLLQYRGTSFVSRRIQDIGSSPYSHSAMIRRMNGTSDVLEIREWIGGRARPLAYHAAKFPQAIDVFRFNADRWPEFDIAGAVRKMRDLTGREYGYWGAFKTMLRHLPILKMTARGFDLATLNALDVGRLFRCDDFDIEAKNVRPFCSQAVSLACRLGGGVDPVPNFADYCVEPGDLSRSLFFQYQFSIDHPTIKERQQAYEGDH